jgi:hypothetical protein
MQAKIGNRVSIDAKKVGQPRRIGVIRSVTKGISGIRYQIRWEDGHESMISPGAGNLTVESGNGKSRSGSKTKRPAAKKAGTKGKKSSKR